MVVKSIIHFLHLFFYNKVVDDIKNYTIVSDPNIVNESVVIQLRPLYGDLKERSEKGHEFEHFYELYDALD